MRVAAHIRETQSPGFLLTLTGIKVRVLKPTSELWQAVSCSFILEILYKVWLPLSQSIPDTSVLNLQCICVKASGRKTAVRDEICRLQSTISWKMQWQINQGNTSMWGAQSGDFQLTQVRDNESKGLQWDWYFELILIESLECVVYWVGAAMNQQSRLTQENHNCNTHTHACMPLGTHTHLLIYRNTTH